MPAATAGEAANSLVNQVCERRMNKNSDPARIWKIPAGVIFLASYCTWIACLPSPAMAGTGMSIVSVRAVVRPATAMKFEFESSKLHITEEDIARGYIDVPGTSHLTINGDINRTQFANVIIDFEPNPSGFSSIQLNTRTLANGERDSNASPGGIVNPRPVTEAITSQERQEAPDAYERTGLGRASSLTTSINYRLMLPKGSNPGDLSVPLLVNLRF